MSTATLPHLLTVAEVAEALGVSQRYVRRLIAEGQLRSIRLGTEGHHRIAETELQRLLGTGNQKESSA